MTKLALAGRVALVTGASRGIGRAIASALAGAGADLALCSTRPGGCDAALEEARAQGRSAEAWACDLGSPAELQRLVDQTLARFGRVDLLVNNAGAVAWKKVTEMDDETFDRVLAVNLRAVFQLTRRLLPGMLERKQGRIVQVSSISGTLGTPRLSAYCASKWGVNGFTKALATELGNTGVATFAVMPGSVDTDMLKGSGFTPAMQPSAVAEVVRYLCAEAPDAMNGSLIEVFG